MAIQQATFRAGDPYWGYVRLLMRGDGTDGSSALNDLSSFNNDRTGPNVYRSASEWGRTLTSTEDSLFGNGSILHKNLNCEVRGLLFSETDFPTQYGHVPFTLEFFWRSGEECSNHTGVPEFFRHWRGGIQHFHTDKYSNANLDQMQYRVGLFDTVNFDAKTKGTGGYGIGSASRGKWHHLAYCNSGTNTGSSSRLFVNGEMVVSWNGWSSSYTAEEWYIFGWKGTDSSPGGTTVDSECWYDQVRMTVGVDRYPGTTTFTPPTAPFQQN